MGICVQGQRAPFEPASYEALRSRFFEQSRLSSPESALQTAPSVNLLRNSSFEQPTSTNVFDPQAAAWIPSNTSLPAPKRAILSPQSHSGCWALQGNNSTASTVLARQDVGVSAGTPYILSAWVYNRGTTVASVSISGATTSSNCPVSAPAGMTGWARISCQFTPSSSSVTVLLNASSGNVDLAVDTVELVPSAEAVVATADARYPPATGDANQNYFNSGIGRIATNSIYHISGDLTIDGSITAPVKTVVVFVDKNLYIKSNIDYAANNSNGGLVFIVRENVHIGQNVTTINGIILTQGQFCSGRDFIQGGCTSIPNASQLTINGSVISLNSASPPYFSRNLADNAQPAELINFQPKYYALLRNIFSEPVQIWSEIADPTFPGPSHGPAVVFTPTPLTPPSSTTSTDTAPRFPDNNQPAVCTSDGCSSLSGGNRLGYYNGTSCSLTDCPLQSTQSPVCGNNFVDACTAPLAGSGITTSADGRRQYHDNLSCSSQVCGFPYSNIAGGEPCNTSSCHTGYWAYDGLSCTRNKWCTATASTFFPNNQASVCTSDGCSSLSGGSQLTYTSGTQCRSNDAQCPLRNTQNDVCGLNSLNSCQAPPAGVTVSVDGRRQYHDGISCTTQTCNFPYGPSGNQAQACTSACTATPGQYYPGNSCSRAVCPNNFPASTQASCPATCSESSPRVTGYFRLNENFGSSAADSSGNNLTGTLFNNPIWNPGRFGNGLSFDGIDDYLSVADHPTLSITGNKISLSAWIKPDRNAADEQIVGKWGLAQDSYQFRKGADNKISFKIEGPGNVLTSASALGAGNWYHVVGTYDGASLKIYINGALDNSVSLVTTLIDKNSSFSIGRNDDGAYFKGTVDEVLVYSYALSAADVTTLFNGGTPGQYFSGSACGLQNCPNNFPSASWSSCSAVPDDNPTDIAGCHSATCGYSGTSCSGSSMCCPANYPANDQPAVCGTSNLTACNADGTRKRYWTGNSCVRSTCDFPYAPSGNQSAACSTSDGCSSLSGGTRLSYYPGNSCSSAGCPLQSTQSPVCGNNFVDACTAPLAGSGITTSVDGRRQYHDNLSCSSQVCGFPYSNIAGGEPCNTSSCHTGYWAYDGLSCTRNKWCTATSGSFFPATSCPTGGCNTLSDGSQAIYTTGNSCASNDGSCSLSSTQALVCGTSNNDACTAPPVGSSITMDPTFGTRQYHDGLSCSPRACGFPAYNYSSQCSTCTSTPNTYWTGTSCTKATCPNNYPANTCFTGSVDCTSACTTTPASCYTGGACGKTGICPNNYLTVNNTPPACRTSAYAYVSPNSCTVNTTSYPQNCTTFCASDGVRCYSHSTMNSFYRITSLSMPTGYNSAQLTWTDYWVNKSNELLPLIQTFFYPQGNIYQYLSTWRDDDEQCTIFTTWTCTADSVEAAIDATYRADGIQRTRPANTAALHQWGPYNTGCWPNPNPQTDSYAFYCNNNVTSY